MALFPKFPYLNFHELNLNWIIEQVKENKTNVEDLKDSALTSDYKFYNDGAAIKCTDDYDTLVSAFASGNPNNAVMSYCGISTTVATISENQMIGKPISFSFILGAYPTSATTMNIVIKTISMTASGTISSTSDNYEVTKDS